MKYIDDWSKRKERLLAFWEQEIVDRCCVSVLAPGRNMTEEEFYLNSKGGMYATCKTQEDIERMWTDPESIAKHSRAFLEKAFLGGDAIPQIFVNLGDCGHGGFFKGSKYQFKDSIWFQPFLTDDKAKLSDLIFDKSSLLYRKTIEMAKYFVEDSGGDYFVSMPDVTGNIDALAHARGTQAVLTDLIDDREFVKEALAYVQEMWYTLYNEYYPIVSANNEGGSSIGWLNSYSTGKTICMQSDMSVMFSVTDFEELIMPELRAQAEWADRSIYHLDGVEQLRFLPMLLDLKELNAIQWTCVTGQPSPLAYIPVLKQIQRAGKSIVIGVSNPSEIESLLENLSSKGLIILAYTDSQDEAEQLIRLVEKHTRE